MQAPSSPIIVKVVEKNEIRGLGDVMFQAVGLTGAMALGALVLGLVLAAVIIGYRRFRLRFESDEDAAQTQPLGLTPTENLKSKI
jgi:Na+/H+-dicarboxylate symporter